MYFSVKYIQIGNLKITLMPVGNFFLIEILVLTTT
jgi:hypothetical protein